jgi:gamma-butyrobetaine dioxygenase
MRSAVAVRRLSFEPATLRVEWTDGAVSEFASVWLRDNLAGDRDAHSGQRLVDITDLPAEPRIRSAVAGAGTVRIEWQEEAPAAEFSADWLAAHAPERRQRPPELNVIPWLEGGALDARRDFAWIACEQVRVDAGPLLEWLTRLTQQGIAFVRGVPAEPSALLELAARIGRVCETNYGIAFDVRAVPQPENLAYSDAGLGLHTDNPYREPVPGFQALHALVTAPTGGDSLFADGFALATHLRAIAPEAFERLTQTAVPFAYRSRDAELYAERPLIQLSCQGEVQAVHYNNRSIAPLPLATREAREFYAAYRRFAALLREPRFQAKYRLQDGDLVVFDNQRVLHGRTPFSSGNHARHLRGCYLTRDSLYSKVGMLRRRLAQSGVA